MLIYFQVERSRFPINLDCARDDRRCYLDNIFTLDILYRTSFLNNPMKYLKDLPSG